MDGPAAYAQAVTTFVANAVELDATTPEEIIRVVLQRGYKAQRKYAELDPQQPEASFVLRHRPDSQGKPS
jgi:hypothetical protein